MKLLKFSLLSALVFGLFLTVCMACSCSTEKQFKKDCKGVRHERLSNGIYL